jgi:hypothetical protein
MTFQEWWDKPEHKWHNEKKYLLARDAWNIALENAADILTCESQIGLDVVKIHRFVTSVKNKLDKLQTL